MTAIWTTPRTWVASELLTAALLNAHVRDNLDWMKTPPSNSYALKNLSATLTTTSTSFGDADATNLSLTITTVGGPVLIVFSGAVGNSGANTTYLDITVDGTRQGDTTIGITSALSGAGSILPTTIVFVTAALAAGSHTFKIQWRVTAGTGSLYKNGQFYVREF